MRLLTDAHVSPSLARQLRHKGVDIVSLPEWLEGRYRTASDEEVLAAAYREQRVFVTYDCRTIPNLLKEWAELGSHHAGVILVDQRTIRPQDVGRLLSALRSLLEQHGDEQSKERTVLLGADD